MKLKKQYKSFILLLILFQIFKAVELKDIKHIHKAIPHYSKNRIRDNLHKQIPSFLQKKQNIELCYAVVFDAGSSGTRYEVFQWNCNQNQEGQQLLDIKSIKFYKDSTPISNYYDNPEDLEAIFEEKFEEIKEIIPNEKHQYTDIYLGATEGMRQEKKENQEIIIKKIREIFKISGFRFSDPQKASVITGQQEGIYLWFSINYNLKVVQKQSDILSENTVTTIDIGGKSAQITYIKQQQNLTSKEEEFLKQISSNQDFVFVVNSEKLGVNYARFGILKQELQDQIDKFDADSSGAEQQEVFSSCFNKGYEGEEQKLNLKINGQGNPIKCINQIRKFLKIEDCDYPKNKDCSNKQEDNKILQVPKQKTIYAADNSMFARQQFNLPDEFDPFELRKRAISHCKKKYCQINQNENKYTPTKCFQGLYVSTLLIDHFGINSQKVNSPSKIQSWQPSWGIGLLFFELSNLNCDFQNDQSTCYQMNQLFESF